MLKDGRPYTNENGWEDKYLITDKPEKTKNIVLEWIKLYLSPTKKAAYPPNSYSIKHILEDDTGIYLTNNEMKDALLMCGYKPIDPNALNWEYNISGRSPAFKEKLNGKRPVPAVA